VSQKLREGPVDLTALMAGRSSGCPFAPPDQHVQVGRMCPYLPPIPPPSYQVNGQTAGLVRSSRRLLTPVERLYV
jgi:hypothetical protein